MSTHDKGNNRFPTHPPVLMRSTVDIGEGFGSVGLLPTKTPFVHLAEDENMIF